MAKATVAAASPPRHLPPHPIQHLFLPSLRALLEETYHRGQLVDESGWAVPYVVELNVHLRGCAGSSPSVAAVTALLGCYLRHHAANRGPISSGEILEFLGMAGKCADLL